MSSSHSILIVDDNPRIRSYLTALLSTEDYCVHEAADGKTALTILRQQSVDLILLDMEMPGLSGLRVLAELRTFWHGPVIIVSGVDAVSSKVSALDEGANDYVEKPFDGMELLARVRANLRKPHDPGKITTDGNIEMDVSLGIVRRNGRPIRLSRMEAILMMALSRRNGVAIAPEQLTTELWGRDDEHSRHTLRVLVRKLRLKVERDPQSPKVILTSKSGYRIAIESKRRNFRVDSRCLHLVTSGFFSAQHRIRP